LYPVLISATVITSEVQHVQGLRFLSLIAVCELLFAALTLGQTFEVKDRDGSVVLTISAVKMFRHSDREDLPIFEAVVKNVSGQSLTLEALKGTVHKKDGSIAGFVFALCDVRWCEFPKDSERDVSYQFDMGSFTTATFDYVTFSWQSESERVAAEATAAEAAHREQLKAAERARGVLQQVIGQKVYAVAYSNLYKVGTPADIMARGTTFDFKGEEVRITEFPRLVPLQIVLAEMTSEAGGGVILKISMPNGQEAISFMDTEGLGGGQVMSNGTKLLKAIGSYGVFLTAIPKLTPREIAAVRKESIFRGMSRRALEFVYLRQGVVVDWQTFDIR
jgi:hypothetical protein